MTPVLVHTYFNDGDWDVYFGLAANETDKTADVVVSHNNSISYVTKVEHYDHKVSGMYYVKIPEVNKMIENIMSDVSRRGLWEHRIQSIQNWKAALSWPA